MVHYDPLVLPAASLVARIGELMEGVQTTEERLLSKTAEGKPRIVPNDKFIGAAA
jgi:hypothetical protein